jgi:hypothetical protein
MAEPTMPRCPATKILALLGIVRCDMLSVMIVESIRIVESV